jgi:nucleotide-binding universal stress UspA family protein
MFKHLLVPLDGSELSERALLIAREVLGQEGTLTLLNVVDFPDISLVGLYDMPILATRDPQNLGPAIQENARTYLHQVAEKLHLPQTIKVNFEVYMGNTASVIVERAQTLHVDAIAMSTHGRSGFSRWFFGSVTQRVLSLMPCPVLVVPGQIAMSRQPVADGAVHTVS